MTSIWCCGFDFNSVLFSSAARDCWDFMCNGCKLMKVERDKKHNKYKGKKKYFVLDEDLMGFRYRPSKKPKGYKGTYHYASSLYTISLHLE